jgi:hypothetical protein
MTPVTAITQLFVAKKALKIAVTFSFTQDTK